jgi:ABC-type multidrug transport system ATPase subunit
VAHDDFDGLIRVQNLRKEYNLSALSRCCCRSKRIRPDQEAQIEIKDGNPTVVAVENTSFGLSAGECFAMLGVNGAGKTTCFKSLTNEIKRTSGNISVKGFDIETSFS